MKSEVSSAGCVGNSSDGLDLELNKLSLGGGDETGITTKVGFDGEDYKHYNRQDRSHVECPDRTKRIVDEIRKKFSDRSNVVIEYKFPRHNCTIDAIKRIHGGEWIERLEKLQNADDSQLTEFENQFDSVYVTKNSFGVATKAVDICLSLADSIWTKRAKNGFAVVRPPGHHAGSEGACGFCLLNNVAVTTHYALTQLQAKRVLIVDLDVHHGHGTQELFYDDPRVLYFSVHRHEFGRFWPHLPISDSDHVGRGQGKGFNVNIPLNQIECSDSDYAAILQRILLPISLEFNPDLVIWSCGFDAVVGDPKGFLNLTPSFFGYAAHLLKSMANGRLLTVLEGGYNLELIGECGLEVMKVMTGSSPSALTPSPIFKSVSESILNCISNVGEYWSRTGLLHGVVPTESNQLFHPLSVFYGLPESEAKPSTSSFCRLTAEDDGRMGFRYSERLKTGLVFDESDRKHRDLNSRDHPECPQRTMVMLKRIRQLGLDQNSLLIPPRSATKDELLAVHSEKHLNEVKQLESLSPKKAKKLNDNWSGKKSVFFTSGTPEVASIAAGSIVELSSRVCKGEIENGLGVLRPPGHHAERDECFGFCFYNNVAVAARSLLDHKLARKIVVFDWDVHHGNGTQHSFWDEDSVLFISIHRYEGEFFFPGSEEADCGYVGRGKGKGFNVNIPLMTDDAHDADYLAVFFNVVLPLISAFGPDVILVSAGFDAGIGDPLGGFSVSPECYAYMTYLLMGYANGRLILTLEGGYNLKTIAKCGAECLKALHGHEVVKPKLDQPCHQETWKMITKVLTCLTPFWPSLGLFNSSLSIPNN